MQRLASVLVSVLVALGAAALVPGAAQAASRPIVFVFAGLIGPGHVYEPLNTGIRNAGFEVRPLWLPAFDHRKEAQQLKDAVDEAKRADPERKIYTVTHSSSAITNRYFLKVLGGSKSVERTVVLGGVEYGSPTGCFLPSPANGACNTSPLIAQLNAGLDTPGPTEYYSIHSTTDPLSGNLDGRQCRTTVPGYLPAEASFDHAYTAWDVRVIPLVLSSLRGDCPGQWVNSPEGSVTYENSVDLHRR